MLSRVTGKNILQACYQDMQTKRWREVTFKGFSPEFHTFLFTYFLGAVNVDYVDWVKFDNTVQK